MKLAYALRQASAGRVVKAALLLSLSLVTVLGAFAAKLVLEDHRINADLKLKLCKKNASGGWDVIDQAQGTVNFDATTTGVASGDINTNHNWRFRSDKGRQVNVGLQRAGRFRLDATSGLLTLDLPFTVDVNGKRLNQGIKLTTESLSTPIGQLNGKKAEINGRSIIAILIGFTTVKERDLVEEAKGNIRAPGVVGGSAGLNGDLVLTLEINGKAQW